jgi:hypothetical protein
MPPSRTRTTCLRSNIAPFLAGEDVQHIDMLCICLYALYRILYMLFYNMSTEKQEIPFNFIYYH